MTTLAGEVKATRPAVFDRRRSAHSLTYLNRSKTKPNTNLLARLQELADYGFFDGTGEHC